MYCMDCGVHVEEVQTQDGVKWTPCDCKNPRRRTAVKVEKLVKGKYKPLVSIIEWE